jgi:hypothetical protein
MALEVKNNKVIFSKSRDLTEKQKAILVKLPEAHKQRYLMSLLGVTKTKIYSVKNILKSGGVDRLGSKGPGSILKQLERLRNLDASHGPSRDNAGDWIGVEIECLIPHDRVRESFECNCEFDEDDGHSDGCATNREVTESRAYAYLKNEIRQAGISRVSVKYDGSLSCENGEGEGVEVTMVFNSKRGFEPLQKLCDTLRRAGCYVNKTCGLHVHLDARHLETRTVKRVGRRLGRALPVIKYLVDASRHNNNYCELSVSRIDGERYHAVNLTAYNKYKTVEVRLHGGSMNYTKISNWIKVLKLIATSEVEAPMRTFQDLLDVGISDELAEYAEKRIKELHGPEIWALLNPAPVVPTLQNFDVVTGNRPTTGAA